MLIMLSILDMIPLILDWKIDRLAVELIVLWLRRVCLELILELFKLLLEADCLEEQCSPCGEPVDLKNQA